MSGDLRPQRVQLRRTRGYRKPEGAIVVSRPSKWGNPYKVHRCDDDRDTWAIVEPDGTPSGIEIEYAGSKADAVEIAVDCFRHERDAVMDYPTVDAIRAELRGRDLACWCALDGQPCHADVLLEIANSSSVLPVPVTSEREETK